MDEGLRPDPSYARWIVDRLEKTGSGGAGRRARDRQKYLVVLTKKGTRTRAQLAEEFHRPPPEITALDRVDLQALDVILARSRAAD